MAASHPRTRHSGWATNDPKADVYSAVGRAGYNRRERRDFGMSTQRQVADELKAIIERVVAGGDTSVEEVKALLDPDPHFTRPVAEVWHVLFHWAADADIRSKDAEYAAIQRENLASALAGLNV